MGTYRRPPLQLGTGPLPEPSLSRLSSSIRPAPPQIWQQSRTRLSKSFGFPRALRASAYDASAPQAMNAAQEASRTSPPREGGADFPIWKRDRAVCVATVAFSDKDRYEDSFRSKASYRFEDARIVFLDPPVPDALSDGDAASATSIARRIATMARRSFVDIVASVPFSRFDCG